MSREDILAEWLERIDARLLWTQTVKGVGTITAYRANARVFLVQHYAKGNGWEVFVPSSNENDTRAALDGAEIALGVWRESK